MNNNNNNANDKCQILFDIKKNQKLKNRTRKKKNNRMRRIKIYVIKKLKKNF